MRITFDKIMATNPHGGYSSHNIEELIEDGKTFSEIASLDIPVTDRIKILFYCALDDTQKWAFTCDCAEKALMNERASGHEPDPSRWEHISMFRAYLAVKGKLGKLECFVHDGVCAAAWYIAEEAKAFTRSSGTNEQEEAEWELQRLLELLEKQ